MAHATGRLQKAEEGISTMPEKTPPELREEMRGPVMWLTIDREERRNAINGAVVARLSDALARVNGACMAGGMGIMAMCDMAVASSQAVFGLPEVKVGLFPAQVLSVLGGLLPRRVLAEMCITGEPITAAQALDLGLVNRVSDDVDESVDWLLGRMLDKSPAAIRRGLYTMKKIEAMAFEESMAFTESQIGLFALTEDAAEGQLAFREKRKPQWSGR